MRPAVLLKTQMKRDPHIWALAQRLFDETIDDSVEEVYEFLLEDLEIKTKAEFQHLLRNA